MFAVMKVSSAMMMVRNNQKSRPKYWATRLSICSYVRSFACTTHSLAQSLTPELVGPQAVLNHCEVVITVLGAGAVCAEMVSDFLRWKNGVAIKIRK